MTQPSPLTGSPGDLFLAGLDGIVDAIATLGLPVTRDPGDFQPPGVIVQPPTITGVATMQTFGMSVPVEIVADTPGQVGTDWCLQVVAVLLPVLGETASEPGTWNSPINPVGLPSYVITVRVNIGPS